MSDFMCVCVFLLLEGFTMALSKFVMGLDFELGQVFMCSVMAKDQGILKIKALQKTLSIHS
jgi:hypothetical protein